MFPSSATPSFTLTSLSCITPLLLLPNLHQPHSISLWCSFGCFNHIHIHPILYSHFPYKPHPHQPLDFIQEYQPCTYMPTLTVFLCLFVSAQVCISLCLHKCVSVYLSGCISPSHYVSLSPSFSLYLPIGLLLPPSPPSFPLPVMIRCDMRKRNGNNSQIN